MTKLKPCPFCECELIKRKVKTKTLDRGSYVTEEYIHPANDCFMHRNIKQFSLINKEDFEAWNRRVDDED